GGVGGGGATGGGDRPGPAAAGGTGYAGRRGRLGGAAGRVHGRDRLGLGPRPGDRLRLLRRWRGTQRRRVPGLPGRSATGRGPARGLRVPAVAPTYPLVPRPLADPLTPPHSPADLGEIQPDMPDSGLDYS